MEAVWLDPAGQLSGPDLPEGDPLPALGRPVRLLPGVTLRSVFALLRRFPELQRLSPFWEQCAQEAEGLPATDCVTDRFTRLELGRSVELVGFPGEPRVHMAITLYGAGDGEREEIRFLALDYLLDMPLALGPLSHVVLGDTPRQLEFATEFTLFEVLEGIAWQLGFHTAPKQCSLRNSAT